MLASHYKEEARRALESGRHAAVLPPRPALYWRTHDYGLLAFHEERLDEPLRAALRGLLGHGRQTGPERAAWPVRLLYGLAAGGLEISDDPALRGALPGGGVLARVRGQLVCLSADPCACLEALTRAEEAGRGRVLGRLLGDAAKVEAEALNPSHEGSCGRCGGLLGEGRCLGGCCVNHGGQGTETGS
jgi:hypothetical protein